MPFLTMKNISSLRSVTFLLPFLVLGFFTLSACDSDSGGGSGNLDGDFTLERLEFDVSALGSVNVLDTLVLDQTMLKLFGGDAEFDLQYQIEGETTGSRRLTGTFDANDERVQFDFNASSSDLARLLLPSEFTLQIEENGDVLRGSIARSNVDLARYNDDLYGDIGTVRRGTLEIRFRREGAASGGNGG